MKTMYIAAMSREGIPYVKEYTGKETHREDVFYSEREGWEWLRNKHRMIVVKLQHRLQQTERELNAIDRHLRDFED